jgi:hypothetical protein
LLRFLPLYFSFRYVPLLYFSFRFLIFLFTSFLLPYFSFCFVSVPYFSFHFYNRGCFPFILLEKCIVFRLFCFVFSFRFTSFSFRIWNPLFRFEAKQAKQTPLVSFEAKRISLPFRIVSLRTENERRTLLGRNQLLKNQRHYCWSLSFINFILNQSFYQREMCCFELSFLNLKYC